jgi:hypothetical protein
MLIAMPRPSSGSVKSWSVNCAPRSLLNVSEQPKATIASSTASMQKSVVRLFESRQASTLHVAQSSTAHRYKNPAHRDVRDVGAPDFGPQMEHDASVVRSGEGHRAA